MLEKNRSHTNGVSRRDFIKSASAIAGLPLLSQVTDHLQEVEKRIPEGKKITITRVDSNFEREPLIRPFGFKGGYMTEIWQSAVLMTNENENSKIGLCTQNVLWSDAEVFASHSEAGGNTLMYALTERALQIVNGETFTSPVELLDHILEEVYVHGKKITDHPDLRKTFALNALVGIDNAAWLLFAAENGIKNFDAMIPEAYRPALSHHHDEVASIPLMAYAIPVDEIERAAQEGYFFMKIKIGQPGTQEEMLKKDMERLSAIHRAIGSMETPHSSHGKLPYYFDANGRYEHKDTLNRLLDHARKIGAFDQIAIIEEPFPEEYSVDVSDVDIRLASDESAHTDKDALERIQMGYKAIALKAIAKTLSMTMKIAQVAHEHGIPCFCADLTVNPILIEWNKNVAARLSPFPGLGTGLVETNGHQNYLNWEKMVSYHPCPTASWRVPHQGVFQLDTDYYEQSGCIFETSDHYTRMFEHRS